MQETMQASLLTLWENVPPYPAKSDSSLYTRTGTLGRSLGGGMNGGQSGGEPDIYRVAAMGNRVEGRFGSNVVYAPYVIGDAEQARQNERAGWYTLGRVAERAMEKITRLWQGMADDLARFADGKGA